MTAPKCPYCHSHAILEPATTVYGPNGQGNVWLCSRWPACDAYTGALEGMEPTPKGTLANAALRAMRIKAHRAFEVKWRGKPRSRVAKLKAYAELSRLMGIEGRPVHIGSMDEAQCQKALMVLVPVTEARETR